MRKNENWKRSNCMVDRWIICESNPNRLHENAYFLETLPESGINLFFKWLEFNDLSHGMDFVSYSWTKSRFMKTGHPNKILILLLSGMLISCVVSAQVASWTFNNVLTGTGSATSIAGNASLGSTIAAGGAFNGGTVYYGEGNWPAGGIDLNAYLEFSITPVTGHNLTISSLSMQIRRSTTGASGSGPNTWVLRSSLDGYTTDISTGVLTTNISPSTVVTLGIAFINMPAKVTFRLYGYNASVSSGGGLNRFVYDNIQANGSSILPVVFDFFKVKTNNNNADISWKLDGEGNLNAVKIERAAEGKTFEPIKEFIGDQSTNQETFEYMDMLNNPSGVYAYRIQLVSADGIVTYSTVQTVSFHRENAFRLQAINTGNNNQVYFRVNAEKAGNYIFSLFNLNGNKVAIKSVQLGAGTQNILMDNRPIKPGMYVLLGELGADKISTKILVL